MKTITIWLALGDHNSKYFHKLANFKKIQNTLCELKDQNDNSVKRFKGLVDLGVNHFQDIFKELERAKIGEVLKVVSHFPRMIE
jgi:hypothetical protein